MWELDHKAKCQRIDAFKLRCWRRLLRVLWSQRRSNKSILKEVNPEYSLEGWCRSLKLQYFGHLIQRANSLEKTLMLGKIEGKRKEGVAEDEMVGHEFKWTPGDSEGQRSVCCSPWGCRVRHDNLEDYIITWKIFLLSEKSRLSNSICSVIGSDEC